MEPTRLVMLIHAFNQDGASLDSVADAVREAFGDADIRQPSFDFGTFATTSPEEVLKELMAEMDTAWADSGGYDEVILVGHSMGAIFARKLYVLASGENPESPFEDEIRASLDGLGEPRPWARSVTRIVLLAGMNRGWSINHHMSLFRATLWTVGTTLGGLEERIVGRPPIIFSVRRGAPFLTQLRLQWLAMQQSEDRMRLGIGSAPTVQLLGSIDDLVSPEDNIDLVTGRHFYYLDVPASGHGNVIEMNPEKKGADPEVALGRRRVFQTALTASPKRLRKIQAIPGDPPDRRQERITDVVFVIHGIRDEGYWTQKIARRVVAMGRGMKDRRIATETSTYGYFPMLSFLRPRARREKVEWLMDRYTEARATYPNARFHYVGHSNGTYLLARALKEYPACRFDQVVFAGSVVRQQYEWSDFMDPEKDRRDWQVQRVLNFVATNDLVVAIFPRALQMLDLQDLGSAGHDGFDEAAKRPAEVVQPPGTFVAGGHGAALQEEVWDTIASFVLTGQFVEPPSTVLRPKQSFPVRWGAPMAPVAWLAILAVLLWLLWKLLRLRVAQWQRTILVVGYAWLVWTIVTRF